MKIPGNRAILISITGLFLIATIPLMIFGCKNNLMDVLEAPEIAVIYDGKEIAQNSEIRLANMELGESVNLPFIIKNKGRTTSLNLTGNDTILLTGDNASMFSISGEISDIIAPRGSFSFTVSFSPIGSIGEKRAHIVIENDDKDESSFAFDIVGKAGLSSTDMERPGVTLSTTAGTITNSSIIPVNVEFSEEVVGFTKDDINITGGILENFTTEDNTIFTLDIIQPVEGQISLYIPSDSVTDIAANGNTSSNVLDVEYDITPPTVTVISDDGSYVGTEPIPITITFSEEVSGFDALDIALNTGVMANFTTTNNRIFTADIDVGAGPLEIEVNISDGAAADITGNPSSALSTPLSISFNDGFPTLTITSDNGTFVKTNPTPVSIDFSEAVTGFNSTLISISGCTISNFQGSANTNFTFNLNFPQNLSTASIHVEDGVVQASAGEQLFNAISNTCEITFDETPPTGSITIDTGTDYTNLVDTPLHLTSSDADGVGVSDMRISGTSNDTGAAWIPFTELHTWTLAGAPDNPTSENPTSEFVYIKFRDQAGNESAEYEASAALTEYGRIGSSKFGGAKFN